jgi:hypothetical protein
MFGIMKELAFVFLLLSGVAAVGQPARSQKTPRIVNIVNFIRLLEPRDTAITEDVLFQTVVRQLQLMRKYHLNGTFLIQYDALMDPRYQGLLRSLPRDSFEIGGWWELPQPLVEKAGIKWRGRYPWDWRANIGFATGYAPAEREKLIDVYMADFFRIFGYYPATVGSWFIDAHSLAYMYTKYHIVASCNCKDQYGTDGYTLWGGYWNQAYYPSKINSYMPAQHKAAQIPVPIFRMLGSDPIRQYDNGLGGSRQGVVTLEPVYAFGGGDSTWVHWFFDAFTTAPDLGFNYTQSGQENSFTWAAMAKGLELQFPLIARLRGEGKVRVETMEASGRWFAANYVVTPATSFTVQKDIDNGRTGTLWYDSRFYRCNLYWKDGMIWFRDIHLFDERFPSAYETKAANSNECRFFTLPFVDGFLWSKQGQVAGLRLKARVDGREVVLTGGEPVVENDGASTVQIRWPVDRGKAVLEIRLTEDRVDLQMKNVGAMDWYVELNAADGVALPIEAVGPAGIDCRFEGMSYRVGVSKGNCLKPDNGAVFRIRPQANAIILKMGK